MTTSTGFNNNRTQAVRLPAEMRFPDKKDRKSNATSGSIFDSGRLSQSIADLHQEILGGAINLPYRTPGTD